MNRFRLEPVLRYRISVEETLRGELTEKRERLNAEKEGLCELAARRLAHLRTLAEKLEAGLSAAENVLYIAYLKRMEEEMKIRKKAVDAAEEAAEIARGRLIDAVRERKTLERLKEKQMAAHQKNILRKEAAFLDEIAVNRFNRNGNKGGSHC